MTGSPSRGCRGGRASAPAGALARLGRAGLAGACLLLAGCYTQVPVSLDSVRPAERVRAQISLEAAERVGEILGEPRQTLEGTVTRAGPDELSLLVPAARVREGYRSGTLNQELRLSRDELLGLQLRRLDRTRTAIVAVGVGAAVGAALVAALTKDGGASQGGGPPGGGPEVRIPLGSIPVR